MDNPQEMYKQLRLLDSEKTKLELLLDKEKRIKEHYASRYAEISNYIEDFINSEIPILDNNLLDVIKSIIEKQDKDKEWIDEAQKQLSEYQKALKYLKNCDPDEYEEDHVFKVKDITKNILRHIKFLEDGIRLIQEKK